MIRSFRGRVVVRPQMGSNSTQFRRLFTEQNVSIVQELGKFEVGMAGNSRMGFEDIGYIDMPP